jgi:hypothetical protein
MEDALMGDPARKIPPAAPPTSLARTSKPSPADTLAKPIILNVGDSADRALAALEHSKLKLTEQPENASGRKRNSAVVTGLKDLQQLQKQTIAVLEAVKGNLEDIRQVLRSPEATRGMEKQQHAAALLAKGFATEAAAQARGAVELLPANPEDHLLLSLSLAANQEFDDSLAAARKGLALFDRRQHPLAIEAGLLHAIGALGHGAEAAQRWNEIIDALPLAVFLDHIGRIAVCYPSNAPEGQLDKVISRRILRDVESPVADAPANCLFSGLDATKEHNLPLSQRGIQLRIAMHTRNIRETAEILRFLGDYVVALSERGHQRTADALSKRCVRRLLEAHADAPTLHRALLKLELADVGRPAEYLARLLAHWRAVGGTNRRRGIFLTASALVFFSGAALFGHAAANLQFLPKGPWGSIAGTAIQPLHVSFAIMALGAVLSLGVLLRRTKPLELPFGRGSLRAEEIRFVRTREVKDTFRRILRRPARA